MKTLKSIAKRQFMIEFVPAVVVGMLIPIALFIIFAYSVKIAEFLIRLNYGI